MLKSLHSDDEANENSLNEFLKKKFYKNGYSIRTYAPKPNCLLKPDALKAMPPEDYRNSLTPMERRNFFFKHLKLRDILYLQAIHCEDNATIKFLILAKHGDLMRLQDLQIFYYVSKSHPELLSISRELVKFDLIRGALWAVHGFCKIMFSTNIFSPDEMETVPTLGLISATDLPHYVGTLKVGMTYAGYIQRSKGYRIDEDYCKKQLRECLGLDTNHICSFSDEWNGKSYPASQSFDAYPSTQNMWRSVAFLDMGDLYNAFYHSNKAIKLNPDNVQARVTRGKVYANLGKMKKAFVDTIDSLKLDPQNEEASKLMCTLLVDDSRTHLRERNFIKWHEYLVLAANYNPQDPVVQELLSFANTSPDGVPTPIQPHLAHVRRIYSRVFNNEYAKRKRVKQFYKLQRRRIDARQEAKQRARRLRQ